MDTNDLKLIEQYVDRDKRRFERVLRDVSDELWSLFIHTLYGDNSVWDKKAVHIIQTVLLHDAREDKQNG